jgi:aspartate kinase
MKFGGSVLKGSSGVLRASEVTKRFVDEHSCILVASALQGVTDELERMADLASAGEEEELRKEIKELLVKHEDVARDALHSRARLSEALDLIQGKIEELERLLMATSVLRETTPRTRDMILSFGEALSGIIFHQALLDAGVKAERFMGGEAGIVTDEAFGEASPLMNVTKAKVSSKLGPLLQSGVTPLVAGYTGETQRGEVTTLGRGGSDYAATILAACLGADEVWIWGEADGIMTCDPNVAGEPKVIPGLSYVEAMEMAFFGVRKIHPRAFEPLLDTGQPVRIRNIYNLDHTGTLISKDNLVNGTVVKAIALVRDVGLITVNGVVLVDKPGTAARIFDVLGKTGVNMIMISQSASEASISVIVRRDLLHKAVSALEIATLGKGVVDSVNSEDDVCVIVVVGAGMKGTPGVASKVFGAIASVGVNIRMIAQGSSELNISFAIKEVDAIRSVRALKEAFNL